MKKLTIIVCLFFLTSCVYYGTSRDLNVSNDSNSVCTDGSSRENAKCREEIRKLKDSIEKRVDY